MPPRVFGPLGPKTLRGQLGLKARRAVIHLKTGVVSPGSSIARQLPDLCACVPYPWGQIACIMYDSNYSIFSLCSLIKNISPLFVLYF